MCRLSAEYQHLFAAVDAYLSKASLVLSTDLVVYAYSPPVFAIAPYIVRASYFAGAD